MRNMLTIEVYKERFKIALEQKDNPKYLNKISEGLSKQGWQERIGELDRSFNNIKDQQDFQKYQKSLIKLFDDLYEEITAPGVDDFIGWVNEISKDRNNTNAKELRKYLVEHYPDSSISESVESINLNKAVLEIENSIFHTLLDEVKKELEKETKSFLNDPKQFENKIDDYFQNLTSTLEGLSEIKELRYTSVDQLFTDEQKLNQIDFYDDFIRAILDKGQSLKPQSDSETTQTTLQKVKNRITEINRGISILYNSNIAKSQDDVLKTLFKNLHKEVNYAKGIVKALSQFIDETWAEIATQYSTIYIFFKEIVNISYDESWNSFTKKGRIISLIDEYNSLINNNILTNIQIQPIEDAKKQLKAKANAIDKYSENENKLRDEISTEFTEIINDYGSPSKKQLLKTLSKDKPSLLKIKEEIENNITGLINGEAKLKASDLKASDKVISYLKEDFPYVLNNLIQIRNGFEKFLQESGMAKHLEWVELKCNGSTKGSIMEQDFNEPELMKELLQRGLIKIEIEKKF